MVRYLFAVLLACAAAGCAAVSQPVEVVDSSKAIVVDSIATLDAETAVSPSPAVSDSFSPTPASKARSSTAKQTTPKPAPKREAEKKDSSEDRVWVNGYRRKDGTYVKGHWRKVPRKR